MIRITTSTIILPVKVVSATSNSLLIICHALPCLLDFSQEWTTCTPQSIVKFLRALLRDWKLFRIDQSVHISKVCVIEVHVENDVNPSWKFDVICQRQHIDNYSSLMVIWAVKELDSVI